MPYVYIVECVDGSLYTGWAIDVEKRVKAHNAGRGARYTRMHRPVKLVHAEALPTRAAAMKREALIKKWPRVKKLKLIRDRGAGNNVADQLIPDPKSLIANQLCITS